MRSQSPRRLFILSVFLFAIGAISIIGGRAFNDAKTKPSQAASSAPAKSAAALCGAAFHFDGLSPVLWCGLVFRLVTQHGQRCRREFEDEVGA